MRELTCPIQSMGMPLQAGRWHLKLQDSQAGDAAATPQVHVREQDRIFSSSSVWCKLPDPRASAHQET
eukprot:m.288323 g.288323  ORF g.288323 m.288323 type:complete len:68 (+) comp15801_c1_seq3:249-452(+)